MSTAAAKAKQAGDVATAVMPEELKAKGWKLEQRTINDDQTVFIAGNESMARYTDRYEDADEAIVGAVILQSREEKGLTPGKPMTPKQAQAELERMRAAETAPPAVPAASETPPEQLVDQKLIRIDGGTQPRGELDQNLIREYKEAKVGGAKFPAVDLFFDGSHYWLSRGFHRFFADKAAGFSKTFSRIHQGTQRDAILHSVGGNATHGKRRSDEEKRRAVLRLLEDPEWKKWSDSAIAEAAKVSQPFVSAIRREIDKPAEASPTPLRKKIEEAAGTADLKRFESTGTKKIGKDKVARDTSAIGKTERVKVTDRRRFTETGVARTAVSTETKNKATDIQKLLKGRPLHVSFSYLPGVPGVSVSVRREKPELAARKMIAADLVPPMPEAVQAMIKEQLAAKARKRPAPKKKAATGRAPKSAAERAKSRKKVLAKRRATKKR